MIDTVMFDLDGTLLRFSQDVFLDAYLGELKKVFVKLDIDTESAISAVLAGTKAMIANDGSMLNSKRFWDKFADSLALSNERRKNIEAACDMFYLNEFNKVRSVVEPNDVPRRIVKELKTKGYSIVLATNPLFPACAVMTRLDWIGLTPWDFKHVTHYANCKYCKPNPEYYLEIFASIGKKPEQCLMVGNSPVDDMCVSLLGAETFLVTDYLENRTGVDITAHRRGALTELESYLAALPVLKI